MRESVFLDLEFLILIVSSLVIPIGIYVYLFHKQAISRNSILAFALVLIGLSAVDVFLLQSLAESARSTPSIADDKIFASGLSIALYILPAIFAGVAVNLVSHILNKHLDEAEQAFERQPRHKPLHIHFHNERINKE